jgi:hypothetical protein
MEETTRISKLYCATLGHATPHRACRSGGGVLLGGFFDRASSTKSTPSPYHRRRRRRPRAVAGRGAYRMADALACVT